MNGCTCTRQHELRRIVLTGGPGAGKTAVLELMRRALCHHVQVLPEAAGVIFRGGFPRATAPAARRAGQRAIFHVQHELEEVAATTDSAIALCDRGTVDGGAYWPGPGTLWEAVGTTLAEQLAHYHVVIHLRVPDFEHGYDHSNPIRIESAEEALAIDARIAEVWASHPRRHVIEATPDFLRKAARVIELVRAELPACCVGPTTR